MVFHSKSPLDTKKIALRLAKKLKGGEILALEGDLGGGKTTFTKGLAKALGAKKLVVSPSFLIMKVYNIKKGRIRKFCHIDVYRLKNNKEIEGLGLVDYLNKKDTVTVIEWADKIKKYLSKFKTIKVLFQFVDKNQRKISISNH